jgi:hypothetical protein
MKEGTKETKLILEIINVTSANSNRKTILKRKSHIQCMSETCLTKAQRESMQKEARSVGKVFQGGPTDPEQGKAAVGVGFLSLEGLNVYLLPKPLKDYCDAEATGRCKIVCFDMAGVTCAIAVLYGWTGAVKGSASASRTDDLMTIVQMQFDTMEPGPKAMVGDFNGTVEAFNTLQGMLKEQGWTDVGNDKAKCKGTPGQATCQSNGDAKESRIDYCITNDRLTPAVISCAVDQSGDLPTHRSLFIEINTEELEKTTRELQKPTNFAKLFEEKVQEEIAKGRQETKLMMSTR